MALTKRTAVGRQCWVVTETILGGIVTERRITNGEYAALARRGGPKLASLALPGERVLYAKEEVAYDTFSGRLGDDEYGDCGDGVAWNVKLATALIVASVPARFIKNDELTLAGRAYVTTKANR